MLEFLFNKIASLRQNENLLKPQKVSKYYEHDCLRKFLLLFMSLLTALIVKSSHILAAISFKFLKKTSYTKIERLSIPDMDLSAKIGEVAIK